MNCLIFIPLIQPDDFVSPACVPASVLDDNDDEDEDLTDKADKTDGVVEAVAASANPGSNGGGHPPPLDRRRHLTPAHNIPILPNLPKYSIIIHKSAKETLGTTDLIIIW